MPTEGSSSSSSLGRPIKARPIASICCSPPESVLGLLARALGQHRKELVDMTLEICGDPVLVVTQIGAEHADSSAR